MVLNIKDAEIILKEANKNPNNSGWIKHCICVGNAAKTIARALKEKGMDIDEEKAQVMGYIHDIGKVGGPYNNHVMNGYYYISALGYDEEYANICLTHSYLNNDVNCTAGGYQEDIPFRTEFIKNHEYTIYDKIINLCDLICTQEIMSISDRMLDLLIRKGIHPNSEYHLNEIYKLKKYFDNLLGYDLYELFPEINKNNKNSNKVLKMIKQY